MKMWKEGIPRKKAWLVHVLSPGYRNIYIEVANIKIITKLKYIGMTVKDRSCISREIKSRLNLGNACYHALQNLLSACYINMQIIKI
jgi:hypothetical protein